MKKIISFLLGILLVLSSNFDAQAREIETSEITFDNFNLSFDETSRLFNVSEYVYLYLTESYVYSVPLGKANGLLDRYGNPLDIQTYEIRGMSINFATAGITNGATVYVRQVDVQFEERFETDPLQSMEWVTETLVLVGNVNPAGMTIPFGGFVNGQWHTGTLSASSWVHQSGSTIVTFSGWVTGTGWHSEPIHYYSDPITEYLD